MVALTILALAPLAQFIPKAALAGVLMVTATRMVDMAGIRYHFRATRFDAVIVVATALSAVLVSVEFCILVGTVLSFLMYVPRAARVEMNELVIADSHRIRERTKIDAGCSKLRIFNFEGELFFGSGPEFESHLEGIEEQLDGTRIVILRVKHLRNPDAVCLHLLHDFIERVSERGVDVCLSGVRDGFFHTLEKVGIVEQVGEDRVFREVSQVWTSTATAIEWAHLQLGDDLCEACPRRQPGAVSTEQWHFVI
jgi:SulP family sulfate permease